MGAASRTRPGARPRRRRRVVERACRPGTPRPPVARTMVGATQPSAMRASRHARRRRRSRTTAALITEMAWARRRPSLRKMPRWSARERGNADLAHQLVGRAAQCGAARCRTASSGTTRSPAAAGQHDLGAERHERRDRVVGGRGGDRGSRRRWRACGSAARRPPQQACASGSARARAVGARRARRYAWPARPGGCVPPSARTYFRLAQRG